METIQSTNINLRHDIEATRKEVGGLVEKYRKYLWLHDYNDTSLNQAERTNMSQIVRRTTLLEAALHVIEMATK